VNKLIKFIIEKFSSNYLTIINVLKSFNVRALYSPRPGNGKSLYVKSLVDRVKTTSDASFEFNYQIIRIKETVLNMNSEINKLLKTADSRPTIYHIDIAYEVFKNVDQYLFNLIVSRHLKNSSGMVWRRRASDIYLFEVSHRLDGAYTMMSYLPFIEFRTPEQYLYGLENADEEEAGSGEKTGPLDSHFRAYFGLPEYQRCCYYLRIIHELKRLREIPGKPLQNYCKEFTPVN